MEPWMAYVGGLLATGLVWLLLWIGKMQEHRSNVSKFMDEIRGELRDIRSNIGDIFRGMRDAPVAGSSPLHLTAIGKKMADELNANEWARTLAPKLTDEVAGKEPFQIDNFCERYVERRLSDDMEIRVAKYGYESGKVRAHILSVLHVVLREELLRLRGHDKV